MQLVCKEHVAVFKMEFSSLDKSHEKMQIVEKVRTAEVLLAELQMKQGPLTKLLTC